MQFDRLSEAVERHFPKWRDAVQDARLFVIDPPKPAIHCVQDDSGNVFADWHPDEQIVENFRLPFESIAIESRGCTVLKTIDPTERLFSAVMISGSIFATAKVKAFPSSELIVDRQRFGEAAIVSDLEVHSIERNRVESVEFAPSELSFRKSDREQSMGNVQVDYIPAGTETGLRFKVHGEPVDTMELLNNREKYKDVLDKMKAAYPQFMASMDIAKANIAFMQINCSLLYALDICQPSTFVVEHTHVDFKPREPKPGKVIRSPYRPHYIVLTPGEIRRRFIRDDEGEAVPSGITRRPHERRGHFRRLTSEKFVSKRGQVLWIKPCWVGKTEGVIGKNRYAVRLDL